MLNATEDGKFLLKPENQNKHYEALFLAIDSGEIKLPMFQREFVWDKEQSAKLIDSLLKGYPIGTFIFWKTREVEAATDGSAGVVPEEAGHSIRAGMEWQRLPLLPVEHCPG
jgi:hypothetical protein